MTIVTDFSNLSRLSIHENMSVAINSSGYLSFVYDIFDFSSKKEVNCWWKIPQELLVLNALCMGHFTLQILCQTSRSKAIIVCE